MESHKEIINDALLRCQGEARNDGLFMKMYPFLTENLTGYIDHFDLEGKSLLTVGSSGDQAINGALRGANEITIIDINPYVRYYYYFKVASILALPLEEFDKFYGSLFAGKTYDDVVFHKYLFERIMIVLKELDPKSYEFWSTIFSEIEPIKIATRLFTVGRPNPIKKAPVCPYLTENGYSEVKKKIGNIHITFVNQDVLMPRITRKYDNIWLSNIYGYLDENSLVTYMFNNMQSLLNDGGKLLLAYIYGPPIEMYEISDLYELKFLFENINFEEVRFPGVGSLLGFNRTFDDCALIYKRP